jgi:hypothetical protein
MKISLIVTKFTHIIVKCIFHYVWYVRQKNIQIQLNLAKKLKTDKISKNNKLKCNFKKSLT